MKTEEIKKLAEEIRQNPDDVNGVVDYNTSEIIRLCNEEGVKAYQQRSEEFVVSEITRRCE